jgi:hypothetical protein
MAEIIVLADVRNAREIDRRCELVGMASTSMLAVLLLLLVVWPMLGIRLADAARRMYP